MKRGFIYIIANQPRGTIYLGVTSDLAKRIYEHETKPIESFASKYNCTILVYYEVFDSIEEAIKREKQLKNWKREWKIELIEKENPHWLDLYDSCKA